MYLVRLIYASTISAQFQPEDVEKILASARTNNTPMHVTGLLCFSRKIFLQCLEGGRSNVNAIYRSILKDPRHENVVMLDYSEIARRDFDDWSMGYVPQANLTRATLIRHSGSDQFDPYGMSGASAHELLMALKKTVPTQS